jgi:uncharacterized membrane protein YfcA
VGPYEYQFLLLVTISFIAGIIGSLMGLGGGIIIVPVMTLFFHIDFRLAAGASLIAIIATSSGAAVTYVRNHLSNIRVGMFLEILTTTGAISGALLAGRFADPLLFIAFSLILMYSLFPNGRKILQALRGREPDAATVVASNPEFLVRALKLEGRYYDESLGREIVYGLRRVPLGAFVMYLAGLASGLLGIGSGAFKVLAMDSIMGMPVKSSTATSNMMIGVTAAASAGIYFLRGDIDPFIAAPVALGILAGSLAGTRIMPKISSLSLRVIFFAVIAVISIQMLLRGLGLA